MKSDKHLRCLCCNKSFRPFAWSSLEYCQQCLDEDNELSYNSIDSGDQVEIDSLLRPTGKTPAIYYE